jgi:hypothetical protein
MCSPHLFIVVGLTELYFLFKVFLLLVTRVGTIVVELAVTGNGTGLVAILCVDHATDDVVHVTLFVFTVERACLNLCVLTPVLVV